MHSVAPFLRGTVSSAVCPCPRDAPAVPATRFHRKMSPAAGLAYFQVNSTSVALTRRTDTVGVPGWVTPGPMALSPLPAVVAWPEAVEPAEACPPPPP